MPLRLPKFQPLPTLLAVMAVTGLATAALLARAPHHSLNYSGSAIVTASPATPAPAATPTNAPAPAQPAVAGASTQATTPSPTLRPVAPSAIKPAPAVAASPPASSVSVTIIDPAGPATFAVQLTPSADACAVLEEAKTEGKIASLYIDYKTVNTSLRSAYVRQINSFTDGWTFKVNGVSPLGCSLSHPSSNDQITWRYE